MKDLEARKQRIYNIIECLIALAWANGALDEAEMNWLLNRISTVGFLDDTQRDALRAAIHHPKPLQSCWQALQDNHDRAYILDQALELFHADGEYCETEKDAYQQIYDEHFSQFDEEILQLEIKTFAQQLKEISQSQKNAALIDGSYYGGNRACHMHFDGFDPMKRSDPSFASKKIIPDED